MAHKLNRRFCFNKRWYVGTAKAYKEIEEAVSAYRLGRITEHQVVSVIARYIGRQQAAIQ